MRNSIITLLVFMVTLSGAASVNASAYDYGKRVTSLMKEFSMNQDFQVVNLGKFGLSILKTVIRHSDDKDALELLDLMKDVKQVSIASFDDCDPEVKSRFSSRLSKILVNDYLLVEAKDSGERVRIYAIPAGEGVDISDLIISAPSSGALICIRGRINIQDVANYLESKSK
jgi:hypothetical protein